MTDSPPRPRVLPCQSRSPGAMVSAVHMPQRVGMAIAAETGSASRVLLCRQGRARGDRVLQSIEEKFLGHLEVLVSIDTPARLKPESRGMHLSPEQRHQLAGVGAQAIMVLGQVMGLQVDGPPDLPHVRFFAWCLSLCRMVAVRWRTAD